MRLLLALAILATCVIGAPAEAADRVVILRYDTAEGGLVKVTAALWYAVDPAKALPQPGRTSAFLGAPTAINTALANGTLDEEVHTIPLSDSLTPTQRQGSLLALWASRRAFRDARPEKGEHYGATMDDQNAWRAAHCPGGVGCP